jgi:hypothetical protein
VLDPLPPNPLLRLNPSAANHLCVYVLVHRLREHNDPQRCAQELVDEALRMHSSDNVTVICCCFGEERPKRRVYGSGRFSRSVSQQGLGVVAAALQDQQEAAGPAGGCRTGRK